MATPLHNHPLQTHDGLLAVVYENHSEKIKLKAFSLALEGRTNLYALEKIWLNEQPIRCLKQFKSEILKEEGIVLYQVINGELFLSIDTQERISLTVNYQQQNYTLKLSPQLTILGLKKQLQRQLQIDDFQLLDSYKTPFEESYQLADCGVTEGSVLFVVCNIGNKPISLLENRGAHHLEVFEPFSFVKFQEEVHLDFDDQADYWRAIAQGLNLIGTCTTEGCDAVNQRVYVFENLGIGTFKLDVERHRACCPCCKQRLKEVNNCVFWDCIYSIEGKNEGEPPFHSGKKRAPTEKALTYRDSEAIDIDKWKHLEITTERISTCVLL